MLDDFRKQADQSTFEEPEEEVIGAQEPPRYFLGMKPFQRLILALMLLLIVCLVGVFALLATEKIVLPFL